MMWSWMYASSCWGIFYYNIVLPVLICSTGRKRPEFAFQVREKMLLNFSVIVMEFRCLVDGNRLALCYMELKDS